MIVYAHEPTGFHGILVTVEVDIRRGIPGIEVVGLPAGAVRESRERVRVAIGNAGFRFPQDRILVNLAPSDLQKAGSAYDLPIALAILGAAGLVPDPGTPILALGELTLDGGLRHVRGVLPAVVAALKSGIDTFIVPVASEAEASAPGRGRVFCLDSLTGLTDLLSRIREGGEPPPSRGPVAGLQAEVPDYSEMRGQHALKRALVVAAAGRHNLLLFGAPGSGKTMSAVRFPGILPRLSSEQAMEVAAAWSLAGYGLSCATLPVAPPYRSPHHSTSLEGMTGGGRILRPGEISLAHHGVLFLDEASEFRRDVLQALREPVEAGWIALSRAGVSLRYPARFQLILAANPCPCGNYGRKGRVCVCSPPELRRYWKKIGGPLLDRMDIRFPVNSETSTLLEGSDTWSTARMRQMVIEAHERQIRRYTDLAGMRNGDLGPGLVERFCRIGDDLAEELTSIIVREGLSSRSAVSILKVSRTIADVDDKETIDRHSIMEALRYRRHGETDVLWVEDDEGMTDHQEIPRKNVSRFLTATG